MAVASPERVRTQHVVLDIGDEIGALIVHTTEALVGREIEVSPKGSAGKRTHTDVLERRINGQTVFAAVFPSLTEGDYSLWREIVTGDDVTIVGGAVAEMNWRTITDPSAFRAARPERRPGRIIPDAAASDAPGAGLSRRDAARKPVSAAPMASAPMRYTDDGQVAWDQMWTDFCALALAGGPPHRPSVLEPADADAVRAAPEDYERVLREIERGLHLVTGLTTPRCELPGWVGLECEDADAAAWMSRAITAENVRVRRQGSILLLPAGPDFRREKEIKNVITAVAKTHHYWAEHLYE
jgi:hypothetical protein